MNNRYTILVVDDTKINIDILVELLYPFYEVFVAIDGKTALEILQDESIDLILLDVMMPDMNGYDVAYKMKANLATKNIPIIFITANSNENNIEKAYNVGASDYIVNPFTPKELIARVTTQLKLVQKTNELKKLNAELELRVEKEVEKNRLNDKKIIDQSNLMRMGEMMKMIAHQWRQPLNAINLTSSNLQLKLMLGEIDDKLCADELALIEGYSQHLSKTIDDFRNFFAEDNEKEKTTLNKLIEETLVITKTSTDNKNIRVISDKLTCKDEIELYVNESKQVLLNIIKNAEDALVESKVENPTITIKSLCTIGKRCVLIIKDNAGGIDEKILEKIFEPYFSTKTEKDGTGLGLYMSKIIIEDHCGGKLSVENDKDGAVFRIEFKVSTENNAQENNRMKK